MKTDKDQYYEDLRKRQEKHLQGIKNRQESTWKPCRHDGCSQCVGTGVKKDGSTCAHMISCDCPKCSPSFLKISPESKEFALASSGHGSGFKLEKEVYSFDVAVKQADRWIGIADTIGGDAQVIHRPTMTIFWPERIAGQSFNN